MNSTLVEKIRRRWGVWLVGLFALPLFAISLHAQDQIDYARRLADFSYFELASHQLDQLKSRKQTPKAIKSYIPVVRAYISMRKAEQEGDIVKRVKQIEQAINDLRKFIDKHANHPRLAEARDTFAETLRKAGKLWLKIAKRNKDKQKQARKSGQKHLQRAIKEYGRIAGEMEGFDRCLNKLNQIITHHELARLYDVTGAKGKRRKYLSTVLKKTGDYLWSSCASKHDTLKIRARTYTALSHLELSQIYTSKGKGQKAGEHEKKAQTYFNSITDLLDVLKKQTKMTRTKFTVINNLLLRAYRFWVDYLIENGEKEKALKKVEEIQLEYGNIKHPFQRGSLDPAEFKPGRALLLAKAKIIHKRGARQQALDIVKKLSGKRGDLANEAGKLVDEWSEALGPEPLTPEKVLRMVDQSIADTSYLSALKFIEKGRSKISSRKERIMWEWKFLDRKALVYAKQKRWYEAAVLYEHVHDRYHEVLSIPLQRENKKNQTAVENVLKNDSNDFQSLRNMVLRANYLAARSYGMLRPTTEFKQDMDKYKSLLDHLSSEHPKSEWANKTVILSGDLLRERKEYDEAIKKYDEPEKGSNVWEQGMVKKGYTYFLKGESLAKNDKMEEAKKAFLEGVKVLRSYLDYLKSLEELTADQRRRAWTAVDTISYSYLRESVNQPDELLKFLNEETLSGFNFSAEKMASAFLHRMNAYREKEDIEQAEQVAEKLYNQYPNASATADALGSIASDFERMAKKASSSEKKETYNNKEVLFYYRWIVRKLTSGQVKEDKATDFANNILSVAVKLRKHGISNDQEQSLKRAQELLSALQSRTYKGKSVPIPEDAVSTGMILEEKALVYTYLGNFKQAKQIYKKLGVGEGKVNRLSILNGRARLYMKQMERAKQDENREQLEGLAEKAKQFIFQNILDPAKEEGAVWWRGWRTYIEVMLIAGEGQQATKYYTQLRKRKNEEGEPFGGNADLYKELLDKYPGTLNP